MIKDNIVSAINPLLFGSSLHIEWKPKLEVLRERLPLPSDLGSVHIPWNYLRLKVGAVYSR